MSEWISVDDSLPEVNQRVVAYGDWASELDNPKGDDFNVCTCNYEGGNSWEADGCYYATWLINVTHWMPVEPPK